jgi:hypothetical protein
MKITFHEGLCLIKINLLGLTITYRTKSKPILIDIGIILKNRTTQGSFGHQMIIQFHLSMNVG